MMYAISILAIVFFPLQKVSASCNPSYHFFLLILKHQSPTYMPVEHANILKCFLHFFLIEMYETWAKTKLCSYLQHYENFVYVIFFLLLNWEIT